MPEPVIVLEPGVLAYKDAWDLQLRYFLPLVEWKKEGSVSVRPEQVLILCSHPHVYTLGKSGEDKNVLLTREELQRRHIEFFRNDRGGDVTYHGPGQVVGYPILDLEQFGADISAYMRKLEEVIIRTLGEFGIEAGRIEGATGVWVDWQKGPLARKICAFGVKSSRWVTMHGFALNVQTELSYFDHIVPCGIPDKGVTSMEAELGKEVDMPYLIGRLLHHFSDVFAVQLVRRESKNEEKGGAEYA